MAEYLNSKARADGVSKTNCLDTGFMVAMQMENYCGGKPFGFEETDPKYWPLPNVWLGTSVENQKCADERIPHLLKCPAAIRFLSIEPLLGPVELRLRSDGVPMNQWGFPLGPCGYYCDESVGHVDHGSNSIHWAIVGCESGPGHRFMADEWASRIREQCHRAEVPFFMKQMEINGKVTTDIEKFPPHLRVREFPKVLNRQDAKVAKSL